MSEETRTTEFRISSPASSSTMRFVVPAVLPVSTSVCSSPTVASAMPGLPMMIVCAGLVELHHLGEVDGDVDDLARRGRWAGGA